MCKWRGQKELSKQGGLNKTNLYLNNTYNETFLARLMFVIVFSEEMCSCVCVCVCVLFPR